MKQSPRLRQVWRSCVLGVVMAWSLALGARTAQAGTVTGTITNANGGAIIQGVNVQVVDAFNNFIASGSSNSSGIYTITVTTSGTYYVRTSTSLGFINQIYNGASNAVCAPCTVTNFASITVTGSSTQTIDFSLNQGASIAGTVINAAGTPLVSVNVTVFSNNQFVASGLTNSTGQYSVPGLPTGSYNVRTSNSLTDGYIDQLYDTPLAHCLSCNTTAGDPVAVSGTAPTSGINFTLPRGGVIAGTVTNPSSAGVQSVSVQIYDALNPNFTIAFLQTNSSGVYRSSGLPAGTYFARTTFNNQGLINELFDNINCFGCSVTGGTGINVTAPASGGAASVSTADFQLAAGGQITGTVRLASDSSVVSSVSVGVYNSSGGFINSTSTNSSGVFTLSGLAGGMYYVRTTNAGSQSLVDQVYVSTGNQTCLGCNVAALGSLITVTAPNATPNIDFSLVGGGTISGTITDGTSALSGLNITLLDAFGSFVTSRNTDGSGAYSFGGLPIGSYYLRTSNSTGYISVIYDGTATGATCLNCSISSGVAQAIATAGQTLSGRNLALALGKTVTGTITSAASGNPAISSVNVSIYSSTGGFVSNNSSNASGVYTVRGLPAGTYYARTSNGQGFIDQLHNNKVCPTCANTAGDAIDLTSAASFTANFTLTLGGRVSGTVTKSGTSVPVSGVRVNLYNATGNFVASGTTVDSGKYTTGSGLAAGTYYAQATGDGFVNELYSGVLCNTSNCSPLSGTSFTVAAGALKTGIDFALTTGGTVTGTVTDNPSGTTQPTGIENVNVAIYDAITGAFIKSTPTAASGAFSVRGLPAGTYAARTSNSVGYIDELYDNLKCASCSASTGKSFSVVAGQTTSAINFKLDPGGRITGTVSQSGGGVLPFVSVGVYNSQNQFVTSTSTNQNGVYSTSGLAPGRYFVRTTFNQGGFINQLYALPANLVCVSCNASIGTAVVIDTTETESGINFALAAGGSVAGRVTDAANSNSTTNGLSGVSISLYDGSNAFIGGTSTNATGNFTVTGVPTGTYFARTTNNNLGFVNQLFSGITCASCSVTGGTSFAVTAGSQTTGINFPLTRGGGITGTVTDTSSPPAAIGGVNVQVYSANGQFVQSMPSGANGVYRTSGGLPAGNYFVRTSNTLGYVDELYNDTACLGCSVINGAPVAVTTGATASGIDFSLATGGLISGTITSQATSLPLESISVNVYTANGFFVTSGFTNSQGVYKTGGMPAGSYYVRSSNSRGFIDQVYNLKDCTQCNPTTGTPVSVSTGAPTNNINLVLKTGGRVRGAVFTDTTPAAPVPGVSVNFYTDKGMQVANGFTDSQGNYVTYGGLPSGTYYSRTSNSSGFIDEAYDNQPCSGCNVATTKPVTVTAGADTTGIDYKLVTGGRIAGIVTDRAPTPAPINNARVSVYSSTGAFVTSVTTGLSGKYVTPGGLAAGNYFVRATAAGGFISALYKTQTAAPHNVNCPGCSPLTGTAVAVTVDATSANIDFALAAGGLITGTITEASTGVPLSSISISIYDQNNGFIASAFTDASGRYTSGSGLPASSSYFARTSNSQGYINRIHNNTNCLSCLPNSGTAIPVVAGQTTAGIDFVLTRGGRLSGTITEAGTTVPITGANVTIIDGNRKGVTGATTDNAGNFTTSAGLPSGTYFVRASASDQGYSPMVYNNTLCLGCDPLRGTGVAVTSGTTSSGINFALPVGGGFSGRVTATEGSAGLGDVEVSLFTGQGVHIGTGRTNADGNFGGSGVPAGTYLLRTTNLRGYVDEAYDNKPCAPCPMTPTNATPIAVTARTITTGLNFILDTGGLVTGIVTDSTTGAPLEGVTVSFYQSGVFRGRSKKTNENGFYSISLPVGTYTVVPDHVNGYALPLTGSGTVRTFAETTVTVSKGGDAEVSFPLGACTPPTVSPASLPIMTAGQPYSQTVTASGGTAPYSFNVSSGTLPPGITLNAATGVISGTPTVSGTANFTIAAADSGGCSGTTDYTPFVCGVNLNTTQASYTSSAAAGSLVLAANSTDCAWTATTNASWVTLGSSAGTGSATVNYSVTANPSGTTFRTGTITVAGTAVTITQGAAATQPPFGSFDTPTGATTASGSVAVTGWALDDLGVSKVELWRDRVAGETTPVFAGAGPGNGKIYIADMLFVSGARNDVANAFSSYPFANRAGWGYLMLTQGLWNQGNGTYTLYAFAYDQENKVTTLGSKTLTVDNANATKPFGSIDVPSYGQTVTGSFWNFGWALTPGSTCAITNGNVFMAIDSGTLIPVSYGDTRTDIANAFPGFTNGSGAGGAYYIDTTTVSDGAHQIGWYVVDNCNRTEGIGSRFFTIANGTAGTVVDVPTNVMEAPLATPAEGLSGSREAETVAPDTVSVQLDGGEAVPVAADADGWRSITLTQGSRITVQLPAGASYAAYQLANGERTALPLGSSFDEPAGTFGWEPAPGYLGSYHLVFVAADGSAIPIRVVVKPLQ